ncbi:gamma-glutamyltranspeptidase [Roseomonas stagni]|uniref:Gamma-glutamyltranspeptidase n=1 Tax=Falsiroseomonas algicola TaxID=2716930 RepID=A0A6M1LQS2_9PROT|nr:gamma-glutamyltransferase [Falsiroseomonas algicola]NGM22756.1 gamma-glutamyltranspeptidase [Falsiroseomonas algicola]
MRRTLARPAAASHPALALLAGLALSGCSALEPDPNAPQPGQAGFVRGFLGGAVADDPRAALVARNTLSAGGSAADAAVAGGLMLAVTQPSRAALGGGGACLLFAPRRAEAEAILFLPGAREATPPGADRPAAVPMLARGLFALHARGGVRPFEELIAPAEQAARFGVEVSRGLAADLAAVAGPLLADPGAAAVFSAGGQPLTAGATLTQPDLGTTLGALRTAGVGDLHQGALARRVADASMAAGGGLTVAEMRASVPRVAAPMILRSGNDSVAFLPPPADGGLAAAAAFTALNAGAAPDAAALRGVAVARAWRERGGDPMALVTAELPADQGWPVLPASSSLIVVDRDGMAVSCAFTMNNLFGTGRVAPGTGILLAAAPGIGQVQPPLLSAALAFNAPLRTFRAASAGSGQHAAPIAAAAPLAAALRNAPAEAIFAGVPNPGRGNLMSCPRYLPGDANACFSLTDPRGTGLAIGAVDR